MVDVVRVDERAGWIWYMARSGDNHMLVQLHRVRLNGRDDERLTDPALNHRVEVSPDGKFFVDVEQAHDRAPVTRLFDFNGKLVAPVAASRRLVGARQTRPFRASPAMPAAARTPIDDGARGCDLHGMPLSLTSPAGSTETPPACRPGS